MPTTEISIPDNDPEKKMPWYKSKKMWIAIPLALFLSGIGLAVYQPAAAIAGMLTDSCSGDSNAGLMWEVWLWYLWPVVIVASSVFPAYLILRNMRWWKVVLGILAGGIAIVTWYILWAPVLWITGC